MKSINILLIMLLANFGFLLAGCETDDAEVNETKTSYTLDAETSVVKWIGSGPGVTHDGSFAVSSQNLEVVNGQIRKGTFTIPISSIKNFDLPPNLQPALLEHLKSPDFFNMVLYPEASFTITEVKPYKGKTPEGVDGANYLITGDFKMLNKTHQISFPANVTFQASTLSAKATFKIDRTKWGMTYAADPALGEHHIYPEVALELNLTGRKL
ncbi:YceI family protein [Sabulibacter ruber]|uniref:YceI family protein n=1 Tax=Sabulibacter ruber TaxID=2811901 RepID=UPI001A95CEE7|nr:YceI family protein [Sabulibacter ruber]